MGGGRHRCLHTGRTLISISIRQDDGTVQSPVCAPRNPREGHCIPMEDCEMSNVAQARKRLMDRLDLIADLAISAVQQKNTDLVTLCFHTLRRLLDKYLAE